jgi:hypothetical protein
MTQMTLLKVSYAQMMHPRLELVQKTVLGSAQMGSHLNFAVMVWNQVSQESQDQSAGMNILG